jgi:hypothetical protein
VSSNGSTPLALCFLFRSSSSLPSHPPPSGDDVPQWKGQLTLFEDADRGNFHFFISSTAHLTVADTPGDEPIAVTSLTAPDGAIFQLKVTLPSAAPRPVPNSTS